MRVHTHTHTYTHILSLIPVEFIWERAVEIRCQLFEDRTNVTLPVQSPAALKNSKNFAVRFCALLFFLMCHGLSFQIQYLVLVEKTKSPLKECISRNSGAGLGLDQQHQHPLRSWVARCTESPTELETQGFQTGPAVCLNKPFRWFWYRGPLV